MVKVRFLFHKVGFGNVTRIVNFWGANDEQNFELIKEYVEVLVKNGYVYKESVVIEENSLCDLESDEACGQQGRKPWLQE